MTAAVDETARTPEGRPAVPRLRWWHEVLYVGVFYGVYTLVRNQVGSASVSIERAYANAGHVIDLERSLGAFREATVQGWFLGWGWFLRFWNIFYGSLHFVATIGTLVYLFRRFPVAYPRLRNALLAATGIALVGFALFPMMPPRLLDAPPPYGAGAATGFVDTLAIHGGLWSFDSGTVAKVSNQYAAMPSLHTAWALWCAIALFPRVRRRWVKAIVVAYPVATLFAIVVTGNHFWLDAVGGAVTLALGFGVATGIDRAQARWRARSDPAATRYADADTTGVP